MKAINLLSSEEVEVKEADKYVQRIFKKCKYYFTTKYGTCCLIPVKYKVEDIKSGYHYIHFIVGFELFESIYTSPYKVLSSFEIDSNDLVIKMKELRNGQLSLF